MRFLCLYLLIFTPKSNWVYQKFEELKKEMGKYFKIEIELLWNNETILILCKSKAYETGTVNA